MGIYPLDMADPEMGCVNRLRLSTWPDDLLLEYAWRVCRLDIPSAFWGVDCPYLFHNHIQTKKALNACSECCRVKLGNHCICSIYPLRLHFICNNCFVFACQLPKNCIFFRV